MTQVITLTETAAEQVKGLLAQASGEQEVIGLRIGVQPGGCSGMQYYMEYATEARAGEEVVEDKGVKVFVDPRAVLYLVGTQMDYQEDEMGGGFTFKNPNQTSSCGCGKSFKTDEDAGAFH